MSDLTSSVREASGRADVVAAVERIYAQLDEAIRARKPQCCMSGRCCRFEEYGHRLYVTTLELVHFLARRRQASPAILPLADWDGAGCPWQQDKLCAAHAFRPFGCRIYFCDPSAREWQEELYERLHTQLKQLHESLGVAYFYTEWRLALRTLRELLG